MSRAEAALANVPSSHTTIASACHNAIRQQGGGGVFTAGGQATMVAWHSVREGKRMPRS